MPKCQSSILSKHPQKTSSLCSAVNAHSHTHIIHTKKHIDNENLDRKSNYPSRAIKSHFIFVMFYALYVCMKNWRKTNKKKTAHKHFKLVSIYGSNKISCALCILNGICMECSIQRTLEAISRQQSSIWLRQSFDGSACRDLKRIMWILDLNRISYTPLFNPYPHHKCEYDSGVDFCARC